MEQKTTVHGHIISYDMAAQLGIRYLMYSPGEEAKVFFDEAYNDGSAVFEDRAGTKFKLVHDGGEYQLIHL